MKNSILPASATTFLYLHIPPPSQHAVDEVLQMVTAGFISLLTHLAVQGLNNWNKGRKERKLSRPSRRKKPTTDKEIFIDNEN